LLLLDRFLRDEAELVKFNKPPAIQNPELQNISRISSTEKAPISLVSITELKSIAENYTTTVVPWRWQN